MLSLAALAALMAMAVLGASSASAESTLLCINDDELGECEEVEHVHETSIGHALLLSSFATVQCSALFLGNVEETGSPLVISGNFTYTCLSGCTATEENGPAEIQVLREGSELAVVTGEGLVHVVCGLNCRYNGVGLEGHGLGALAAANEKGESSIEGALVNKESGFLCPSTSELDITTEPLVETFVPRVYCVKYRHEHGLYQFDGCSGPSAEPNKLYELVESTGVLTPHTHVCVNKNMTPLNGLYTSKVNGVCTGDITTTNNGLYELAEVLLP